MSYDDGLLSPEVYIPLDAVSGALDDLASALSAGDIEDARQHLHFPYSVLRDAEAAYRQAEHPDY